MKIAIIGPGHVGGALTKGLTKAGYEIILGVKNKGSKNLKKILEDLPAIKTAGLKESIEKSEVVIIATPPSAINEIAEHLKDFKNKIVIDTTNSISAKPEGYENGYQALKSITKSEDIVKCFNSTGFEVIEDPSFGDMNADMFIAGGSKKAKECAIKLSKDLGFENVYDFGDETRVPLIEQFALIWVDLAIFQKEGRGLAFKILKR